MPLTVHKILIHGSQVVRKLMLPIGMLSEEAQESRNKDYRRIRQENTRKTDRLKTTEDLMHGLLISSDPVISSIRELPKKPATILPLTVRELLRICEKEENYDDEEPLAVPLATSSPILQHDGTPKIGGLSDSEKEEITDSDSDCRYCMKFYKLLRKLFKKINSSAIFSSFFFSDLDIESLDML